MNFQALSASGLRALRYAREIEGIGQVVALDNDLGKKFPHFDELDWTTWKLEVLINLFVSCSFPNSNNNILMLFLFSLKSIGRSLPEKHKVQWLSGYFKGGVTSYRCSCPYAYPP